MRSPTNAPPMRAAMAARAAIPARMRGSERLAGDIGYAAEHRECGECEIYLDLCPTAPPSVLPDISPTRGEIGCLGGFRQSRTLAIGESKPAVQSPPLRGRCPAGQRGARRGADHARIASSRPSPPHRLQPFINPRLAIGR